MALARLTFDDGPGPFTDAVLDVLRRYDVQATFFVIGEHVASGRATVQRAVAEGHAVGNHAWDHPSLPTLDEEAIRRQLESTSEAIAKTIGARPTQFRPPFGDTDERVERIATELGMDQLLWDVDTEDWQMPGAELIRARIAGARPGAVVLLHDGGGDRSGTVAAVDAYLRQQARA